MAVANIIYKNLRAEMGRHNYRVKDISDALGIGRDTAGAKLSGNREFTLKEAFQLSKILFDGQDVHYLFGEKE